MAQAERILIISCGIIPV